MRSQYRRGRYSRSRNRRRYYSNNLRNQRRLEWRKRRKVMIPRFNPSHAIVPNYTKHKLKFSQYKLVTTTPLFFQEYRANSPYDPDYKVGGLQPAGFDQLATLYNKYKVYGVKVKVTYWSDSTTSPSGDQIVVMFPMRQSATYPTGINDAVAMSGSKVRHVAPVSAGGNPVHMSKYYRIADVIGDDIDDADYSSSFTGSPIQEFNIVIAIGTADESSAVSGKLHAEVWYYLYAYEPKQLNLS